MFLFLTVNAHVHRFNDFLVCVYLFDVYIHFVCYCGHLHVQLNFLFMFIYFTFVYELYFVIYIYALL